MRTIKYVAAIGLLAAGCGTVMNGSLGPVGHDPEISAPTAHYQLLAKGGVAVGGGGGGVAPALPAPTAGIRSVAVANLVFKTQPQPNKPTRYRWTFDAG